MRKGILAALILVLAAAVYWQQTSDQPADGGATTSTDSAKPADPPAAQESKPVATTPQGQLPPLRDVPIEGQPEVANPQQAQDLVDQQALNLGPDASLRVSTSTADDYGTTYYQLEQTYKGIQVFGAQALLEVTDGHAERLSGAWQEALELDIEPRYPAAEALRLALSQRGVPAERTVTALTEPSLVVFVTDQGPSLCWRITATLSHPPSMPERYLVDAHTPTIYHQEPALQR